MQIITKDIKKIRQALHEISIQGGIVQRVFFQIHPPVSWLNFSNDISVPLVRVKIREGEHDIFFEIDWLLIPL